jgi:hypothetical protein
MPDTDRLNQVIRNYTIAYRKGEVVEEVDVGGIKVIHVTGYPETPSHGQLVDVHFLNIGFTEASADKDAFLDALKQALVGHGEFCDVDQHRLSGGPSYIETGAWLGSQDQALRFIALGAHYGLWDVVTPALLHITGVDADRLAGNGMVMNSGVKDGAL